MIQGITVVLYNKTQSGVDEFNHPIWVETAVNVPNVLVSPVSSDDVINELNLTGKKVVYELGIPKGDTNNWEDRRVDFFGQQFHTIGFATEGIDANIPLLWNKKIKVERYG